jgi:TusA-related sulfurtransferase
MPSPDPPPAACLDLRGTPCPLNFIRTRLALEKMARGSVLQVDLDMGEPEMMVADGVRSDGHSVERELLEEGVVRLRIRRG